jgi:adenine-specific DNA-methyltransferase
VGQQTIGREKVAITSGDVLETQVNTLRDLFPEVCVEGKIDFDKLRATLGAAAESGPGRFSFTWAGKDDALSLLQTPSRATLVPCPDESVEFETTGNAFIEGDNLEVLKLLFKPYFGRVKLIYIDPPYNTGQDFVYPDNYADPLKTYLQLTGQSDEQGNLLTSNPETSGRYHSAWLSMMYPRLFLARQLLREDGAICVSIDDHEVHHLRTLMNEVFGEENFVASVIWEKADSPRNSAKQFSEDHDYILVYSKNPKWTPDRLPRTEEANSIYSNPDNDPIGPWLPGDPYANHYYSKGTYTITGPTGRTFNPPPGRYWRVSEERFWELDAQGRIWWGPNRDARPSIKRYLSEVADLVPRTLWKKEDVGSNRTSKNEVRNLFPDVKSFDTPKPTKLIDRILRLATRDDDNDLILDFFAGSCTTAQAVLELNREDGGNRQFIMVQLPEPTENKEFATISDIGKERIRRVIAKLRSETGTLMRKSPEDLGFKVFKLAKPNIEQWVPDTDRDPDNYARKLSLFDDPLVPGWTVENVLWELALREGFGLNTRFEQKELADGTTIYEVTDPDKDPPQTFAVCLDEQVRVDLSKHYPLSADTLLICRDKALDDTAAANLALQCRLKVI